MEILIGCAPYWVESSKEIDSLTALCKLWWTIGNSPTFIMDLLIHYNICPEIKCISLSQISWSKVWENSVRPIQQCLFSPIDTNLGTLDHLDGPQ